MYCKSPTLLYRYLGTSLGYIVHIDISILQYTSLFSAATWGGGGKLRQQILWPWWPRSTGRRQGSVRAWRQNYKRTKMMIPMKFYSFLSRSLVNTLLQFTLNWHLSLSSLFIYPRIKTIKTNKKQWHTAGSNIPWTCLNLLGRASGFLGAPLLRKGSRGFRSRRLLWDTFRPSFAIFLDFTILPCNALDMLRPCD